MPVERTVKIDEEIVKPLEDLINNFPHPSIRDFISKNGAPNRASIAFTNCFNDDLKTYEKNQEILKSVIDANYEFYRTDNIPDEMKPTEGTILTVHPDWKVEKLIKTAIDMQGKFLREVLG